MAATKRTILTKLELGKCLATGATRADIAEYQKDGFAFEEILELCQTSREAREADKQADADRSAKAQKRAMRPENEHHPGISSFSYPEGDQARPRPALECETFYAGYPIELDVALAREIELFNQITLDGIYAVEKSDGSEVKIEVQIERNHRNKPTKKLVILPAQGKHNWPKQTAVLEAIVAEQTRRQSQGLAHA